MGIKPKRKPLRNEKQDKQGRIATEPDRKSGRLKTYQSSLNERHATMRTRLLVSAWMRSEAGVELKSIIEQMVLKIRSIKIRIDREQISAQE